VFSSRRPLVTSLAIGLAAVFGVSACTSDPSPTRVAEDLVKTETQGFPEIQDCMLGVIKTYDLDSLGEDATSDTPDVRDPAVAELARFEADLAACDPEGVTSVSVP
jgi:uncharacterized lipoprotein